MPKRSLLNRSCIWIIQHIPIGMIAIPFVIIIVHSPMVPSLTVVIIGMLVPVVTTSMLVLSRRITGRGSRVFFALYLVLSWIMLFVVSCLIWFVISPVWVAIIFSPPLLMVLVRRGVPDRYTVIAVWTAVGWCCFESELIGQWITFVVLTVFLAVGGVFSGGLRRYMRLSEIALSMTWVLLIVRLLTFYVSYEGRSYERIVAQEGISGIYKHSLSDPIGKELMNPWNVVGITRASWIMEACDPYIFYAGIYYNGLVTAILPTLALIDHTTRSVRMSRRMGITSANAILDCEKKTLLVAAQETGSLLIYKVGEIDEPIASYQSIKHIDWIELGDGGEKLYVGEDNYSIYEMPFPPDGSIHSVVADEGHHFVIYRNEVRGVGDRPCALDRRRGTIFYSNWSGMISITKADSGEQIASQWTEPGARFLVYNERLDLLLVVGYARGNLYILDPVSLVMLHKLYVGRGGKWVTFSQDQQRAYIATSAGGFEIDLVQVGFHEVPSIGPFVSP